MLCLDSWSARHGGAPRPPRRSAETTTSGPKSRQRPPRGSGDGRAIEATDEREEALAIAVALRETLNYLLIERALVMLIAHSPHGVSAEPRAGRSPLEDRRLRPLGLGREDWRCSPDAA